LLCAESTCLSSSGLVLIVMASDQLALCLRREVFLPEEGSEDVLYPSVPWTFKGLPLPQTYEGFRAYYPSRAMLGLLSDLGCQLSRILMTDRGQLSYTRLTSVFVLARTGRY